MALTKLQSFNLDTTANFTFANITATNANLGNAVTANYFIGNGSLLTGIDSANANYSNYAGTIVNSSQPNITAVGTLANLTSNGVVNFANSSNVSLGAIANVHITGGTSGYVLQTDGAGTLTWAPQASYAPTYVSNGTSNVNVPTVNGNITLSVGGTSNVLLVTTTGIVVTGNVDAGANYVKGNGYYLTDIDAGTANIANSVVVGNSAVKAQPNGNVYINVAGTSNTVVFTSTGVNIAGYANVTGNVSAPFFVGNGYYLTGIDTAGRIVNGNSNVSITSAGGDISLSVSGNSNVVKVTGTGMNVAGYANITGNVNAPYFIGNGAFLTGVDTSPANISNGTSNVQVTSSGGNITVGVAGNSNVMTVTGVGVNVSGNVNATYFVGNGAFLTGVDVTPASMSNGNSNVSITSSGGNVTVGVGGTGNVVKVTPTGANITGYANITGNVNAPYFIGNGAFLTGVDTSPANISNGNSNVQVTSNGNITMAVSGNVGIVTVTGTGANVDGYITATGNVTGAFVKGNGFYLTGIQSSGPSIANGSSNINIPATNGNITIGVSGNADIITVTGTGVNVAGYVTVTGQLTSTITTGTAPLVVSSTTQVANLNAATSGTVITAAQPNITSVGTLTSLTVGPNSNVTLSGTSGFVQANSIQGTDGTNGLYMYYGAVAGAVGVRTDLTVGAGGTGNFIANAGTVTLGDLGNVKVAGGAANYVIQTDGAGNLSWVSPSGGSFGGGATISNGTANVRTFLNGNVTVSSNGNANILNVTGTGINVAGNVNATYFVGNGAFLTGVDTSPANISNGTSNVQVTSSGNVTVSVGGTSNVMIVTSTGANITGTANITGNVSAPYFIGNGAFLTGVDTSPANISNGTSNVQVSSSGGNVTASVNGNANVIVVTGTGANVAGYVNATGNVNGSNITASGQFISTASQGTAPIQVLSTTQVANLNAAMAGTVSTNAQPNITSVGTLTGLAVSNSTGIVNFTTTANVTLGYVGNLHITGGSANYVLKTDGAGNLSWTAQGGGGGGGSGTSIVNGTSNVDVELSGNVTVTSAGNTIVTVTDTGANIAGYANITGNVALSGANVSLGNVANLHIAGGANNYILKTDGAGNLSWIAQTGGGSGTGAIQEFVATAGQTTFTITGGYNVGSAIVFVNGIQMNNSDYAATNGTTIVLSEARIDGDIVRVLSSMVTPAININSLQSFSLAMSIAMGM